MTAFGRQPRPAPAPKPTQEEIELKDTSERIRVKSQSAITSTFQSAKEGIKSAGRVVADAIHYVAHKTMKLTGLSWVLDKAGMTPAVDRVSKKFKSLTRKSIYVEFPENMEYDSPVGRAYMKHILPAVTNAVREGKKSIDLTAMGPLDMAALRAAANNPGGTQATPAQGQAAAQGGNNAAPAQAQAAAANNTAAAGTQSPATAAAANTQTGGAQGTAANAQTPAGNTTAATLAGQAAANANAGGTAATTAATGTTPATATTATTPPATTTTTTTTATGTTPATATTTATATVAPAAATTTPTAQNNAPANQNANNPQNNQNQGRQNRQNNQNQQPAQPATNNAPQNRNAGPRTAPQQQAIRSTEALSRQWQIFRHTVPSMSAHNRTMIDDALEANLHQTGPRATMALSEAVTSMSYLSADWTAFTTNINNLEGLAQTAQQDINAAYPNSNVSNAIDQLLRRIQTLKTHFQGITTDVAAAQRDISQPNQVVTDGFFTNLQTMNMAINATLANYAFVEHALQGIQVQLASL